MGVENTDFLKLLRSCGYNKEADELESKIPALKTPEKEAMDIRKYASPFLNEKDLKASLGKNISKEELEQLDELFEIAEIMADEDMTQILGKMKKIIFK